MPYFTLDTWRTRVGDTRFIQLADVDGDGAVGVEDQGVVSRVIEESCSEMDSYIGRKYPTPIPDSAVTPVMLMHINNMIIYHLQPDGDAMSETIRNRYNDARSWGCKVSDGKVRIGITESEPNERIKKAVSSPTRRRSARIGGGTRVITSDSMKGLV